MKELFKDSDNYVFLGLMAILALWGLGLFIGNLIPQANAAANFPKVCDMGNSTQQVITVPTAQSQECLTENEPVQDQGVTLVDMLDTLPVATLQTVYTRITGAPSTNTTAYLISEDILYAAFNAKHGANIPEAGFDISGTWPNLTVSF